jgi:hypothetical protein
MICILMAATRCLSIGHFSLYLDDFLLATSRCISVGHYSSYLDDFLCGIIDNYLVDFKMISIIFHFSRLYPCPFGSSYNHFIVDFSLDIQSLVCSLSP